MSYMIFFDLDDTLYDRKLPFQEAFFQFAELTEEEKSGFPITEAHKAFVKRGNEVFDASAHGLISMEEMYIYRFQNAMKDMGRTVLADDCLLFQKMYDEKMKQIHMSDCVIRMLDELKEMGIRMGIITNGPSQHQRDKLRALGMNKWIPEELWIISGDYDTPKPDPFMYKKAEELTNCLPENMIYVGDSYDRDILGAIPLGWKTLWLNKKTTPETDQVLKEKLQPDMIAVSEEEMGKVLIKYLLTHQNPL